MSAGRAATAAVLVGLAVGVGVPLVELRVKCAVPDSEGCVWAHALLPVSFGVSAALGLLLAGAVFLGLRVLRRR